jgi:uncharacterized repeat protein (TIGR04052 family)
MRMSSLIVSLPIMLATAGLCEAAPDQQQVKIRFGLQAGDKTVDCSHEIGGLGLTKANARLRDARFYISAPALIDAEGNEVPIALTESEWQYANVALIDFEDKTGACNGTASLNDTIVGAVPAGDYKGLRFLVGVPSLAKDKDGRDIVLNHSNFATAAPPLDIQGMSWNWQAGRKFMKIELQPEGGVTRLPMKARAEGENADPAVEAARAQAAKAELLASNADGTVTVKTWMLHFGSTGCKGDAMTGQIVSCTSANRFPVVFESFNPSTQMVVLDIAAMLDGVDLTHDAGGATGCMSGLADPECAPIWERAGLNLKETEPDANDQGKPTPGAVQRIFRAESRKLVESKN